MPAPVLNAIAAGFARLYYTAHGKRREVVTENLLAPLQFDRGAAERTCRELFQQFGLKLADLWRYESGKPLPATGFSGNQWENFKAALDNKRGVLLLTPHIGNWELGAPMLRERGINLQVITQAEPDASLTKLREQSRRRWGIETIVIGENPFAFVEVIRRLEAGAVVALLVDRPPQSSAITVKLFGHRFPASLAAAELARATGCALLPVYLPREGNSYAIHSLPEIHYHRGDLGTREARANLTQEIMRQFEPVIRQYLNQWYHFVPVWEKESLP
jgi:lauroyl/myristoyl acyltransferase